MQLKKSIFNLKIKKHNRMPLRIYLSYLLVITLIFTGVTFSKYLTSTNAGDSARVAAFGDLELVEAGKPEKYMVIPGVDIVKNPRVSFGVSDKSEMAVYVFVSVDAKDWQYNNGSYTITSDTKTLMNWSVESAWTFLKNNGTKQIFYQVVPANESLKNAKVITNDKITVSDELYASDYKKINVAAKSVTFDTYAVQVQGFESPLAAWNQVSGK